MIHSYLGILILIDFFDNHQGFANIVGAALGGAFAYLVAWKSLKIQSEQQKVQRQEEGVQAERRLLLAIRTEIEQLKILYDAYFGHIIKRIEKDEREALAITLHIKQDYFPIYHANASRIGDLNDDMLRHKVIIAYLSYKKLIDNLDYNTILNNQITEYDNLIQSYSPQHPLHKHYSDSLNMRMIYLQLSAKELIESDKIISLVFPGIINDIDAYLKKTES